MPESKTRIRFSPLDFPLLAFFVAALLGIIPAYDRASAIAPALVLAACLGLYGWISRRGCSPPAAAWIARYVTVLAGLIALFFITQSGHYENLEKVGLLSRISAGLAQFFPALRFWTPLANSVAALLEGLLFLSAGLYLAEQKRAWRIITGASAILMTLALLLSQSRGAWLALIAAGLIWLALYFRPARWLALAVGIGLVGLAVMVLVTGDLLLLERIPVVNRTLAPLFIRPDRLEVYRGSLYLLRDVPFTGIGLGQQFAMNYSRYVLLIQVPFLTYSHNFYLETWLQAGLLGLAAVIWLAVALGYCAVQLRRSPGGALVESAWVGLLAILVHGLTDARQYSDLWCWLPFFILAGLVSAGWLRLGLPARRGWIPAAAAGIAALGILTAQGSLLAAWNTNLGSLHQARAELGSSQDQTARQTELTVARAYFSGALFYDPGHRPANLRLGLIELDREWFESAVGHLETAHQTDPANPTVIKALGLAYTWNGQVEQAAKLLANVANMDQELNTWAFWRASQGQNDLSRSAYQVSLRLNPNQPQVEAALRQLSNP